MYISGFQLHDFGEIRDDSVVRALTSHQCDPGSILSQLHRWVEYVVGSWLAQRVFLSVLWFSSLHKNQHSKFQFSQDRGPTWKPAKADVASSLNIVIYLILYPWSFFQYAIFKASCCCIWIKLKLCFHDWVHFCLGWWILFNGLTLPSNLWWRWTFKHVIQCTCIPNICTM